MRKAATFILSLSLLALFAAQFSSCEKYVLPELQVSRDTLNFGAAADSQKILVTTNVNTVLSMGSEDTWVFADPDFIEETSEVTIYVLENETGTTRTLTFPVKSESLERKIQIIQEGN